MYMMVKEVFLLTIFSIIFVRYCECRLNFISIDLGDKEAPSGGALLPAIEVSLAQNSLIYPKLYQNYTYNRQFINDNFNSPCSLGGRQHILDIMSRLYAENKLQKPNTIILAPLACPFTSFPVADFGREMNLLTVTCAPANVAFANKQRFPTLLSFSYAEVTAYGAALIAIMRHFSWSHISIINNFLHDNPASTKSVVMCSGHLNELTKIIPEIDFLETKTDSSAVGWRPSLAQAKKHSRIILVCSLTDPLRSMLATAADMNMTNGDYVFFGLYVGRVPHEPAFEWEQGDTLDEVRLMIPSFFIISSPTTNWIKIKNITHAIAEYRIKWLNLTNPDPQLEFNEHATTCVEMVEVLSQVFNETVLEHETIPITGLKSAPHFHNRTFPGRAIGQNISITSTGMRRFFVELQQYDWTARSFKKVMVIDSDTKILRSIPNTTILWRAGSIPVDRPKCMTAEDCLEGQDLSRIAIIVTVVLTAFIVLFCAILFYYHQLSSRLLTWGQWQIVASDLTARTCTT